jgi:oligopeptide transport system permease protein
MTDTILQPAIQIEEIKGRSLWSDARARLLRNHAAVASLAVLGIMVIVCFVGPYFVEHPFDEVYWDYISAPPNFEAGFYFGTDDNGRDILSRTLYGGRISLIVGLVATFVSLMIGVTWGALAGFVGGRVDSIMMRIVDVLYSLPFIFLVIIMMVVFGRQFILIYLGVGAVSWLDMARIVRGQTVSLKRKEFIEAAHAGGVSTWMIVWRHIIPNTLGIVIVYITFTVSQVIILESFLSFLGLGIQEPYTSWGVLISQGAKTMETAWWALIFPAIFLSATLFALNFIGDGLRDALDPKDR